MNDLLKKLNLLVKSSMNDVLGENRSQRQPSPKKLGKQLGKEVAHLRTRVNDAVTHEETLQDRVVALQKQIAQLDQQADDAIKLGKDAEARHLIGQVQRLQKRTAIAQSDLQEHQTVTQELIQRVNLLDAIVSEARHEQEDHEDDDASEDKIGSVNQSIQDTMNTLSDMLRHAREKLSSVPTTSSETNVQEASRLESDAKVEQSDDRSAVDNEFEARLNRLTKPKKP